MTLWWFTVAMVVSRTYTNDHVPVLETLTGWFSSSRIGICGVPRQQLPQDAPRGFVGSAFDRSFLGRASLAAIRKEQSTVQNA
jgi:hypothetical protein